MSTTAPSTPTPRTRRSRPVGLETRSQVQALLQRIQALLPSEQGRCPIVGVTSCSRREGVSVVAGNLATCASDIYSGKTLLIDANPRHASVASRYGVQAAPGLADCLAGELAFHECIASTSDPNLFVLPVGSDASHTARATHRHTAPSFDSLRQDFELVVIDLPSASEMDEMLPASQVVDGFILVIEAERVRRHVAQRVKQQFEQVNARLLGAVLNKRKNHIPGWLYRRL